MIDGHGHSQMPRAEYDRLASDVILPGFMNAHDGFPSRLLKAAALDAFQQRPARLGHWHVSHLDVVGGVDRIAGDDDSPAEEVAVMPWNSASFAESKDNY